jgi:hypothetical protein
MPIVAKGTSTKFEPAPAGAQQAVCCDVVDLGLLETQWGPKHKVEVRWQSEHDMSDGKPYLIAKRYTLSLNEKANLRHDLEAWRGRAFTEAELAGFDLEKLIGVNCLVNVIHKAGSKGGVFANVVSVMPIGKKTAPMEIHEDYIRMQDRETEPEPDDTREASAELSDDDIPF